MNGYQSAWKKSHEDELELTPDISHLNHHFVLKYFNPWYIKMLLNRTKEKCWCHSHSCIDNFSPVRNSTCFKSFIAMYPLPVSSHAWKAAKISSFQLPTFLVLKSNRISRSSGKVTFDLPGETQLQIIMQQGNNYARATMSYRPTKAALGLPKVNSLSF